jgi:putative membrane protein
MQSHTLPHHAALRLPLRCLLGGFALLWVLAVVGISRDMTLPVDERWAGSGMLAIEGGCAALWVAYAAGWRVAARFTAITVILAYLIEYLGVRTGVPFGRYSYTGLLVPQLPGGVPAPITFAWLLSALGAVAAARWIVRGASLPAIVAVSAALSTLLDACIEPTAAFIKGYWHWQQSGLYYGVPARNFIGWFLGALIINGAVLWVVWGGSPARRLAWEVVPVALFAATLAMFALIALFRGYPAATLIGAFTLVILFASLIRARRGTGHRTSRSAAPSTPRSPADASAASWRESRRKRAH